MVCHHTKRRGLLIKEVPNLRRLRYDGHPHYLISEEDAAVPASCDIRRYHLNSDRKNKLFKKLCVVNSIKIINHITST